jgi:DNA-binding NarL/FixJ family response regulator
LEVLELMAHGAANKEIAASLGISGSTVKTHIQSIFQKLEVNDRTKAVTRAIQRGIIRL